MSFSCILGVLHCPDRVCLAVVVPQKYRRLSIPLSPLTDSSKTGVKCI